MPIIPFGEWLPDQPDLMNPGTPFIENVVPLSPNGYGSFSGPLPHPTLALPGKVVGAYGFEAPDGAVYNFAGTASGLYLQKTGDAGYSEVSKTPGGYNAEAWSFTSYGSRIIATDFNDNIQTYLVGVDAKFSDLSATAPRARYCCVIRDFLLVADTYDATDGERPYRVWWPAIGDPTNWPVPGTNAAVQLQSDFQDLQQTDLGNISGIFGGLLSAADGAAILERGVYRIMYVGSPAIFDFAVAQGSVGTTASRSIVLRTMRPAGSTTTAVAYFLGSDGFYAYDGSNTLPIGAQKVDRSFFSDINTTDLNYVQGTYDPTRRIVMWFYRSLRQTAPITVPQGAFNRALIYNTEMTRWSQIDLSATPVEWVSARTYTIQGFTLDQLDQFGPLDSLPYSLDSRYWTGGADTLAWWTVDHQLAYADGPPMTPTLDTKEQQLFPGKRSRIMSTRPIADGGPAMISIGGRDRQRDPIVYTSAARENVIGDCPQRSTARYTRFRLTFMPTTAFTQIEGIDVTARPEGIR